MAGRISPKTRAYRPAGALLVLLALGSCGRGAPPPNDHAAAIRSDAGEYAGIDSSARVELAATDRMDATMDSLETAGELNQAQSVALRQLETRRHLLGSHHAAVAASLHRLGMIEQQRGHQPMAVLLLEQAVSMRRDLFGDRSPEVAASLYQLAVAEKNTGRGLNSLAHHREALELRRSLYPADSPEIAESLNGLANIHRYLEEYPEALRLMRQALDIRRRAFGEGHLAVAESRMDIGLVEIQMRRFAEAERDLRRARDIRRRQLGPTHFELAVTANLLALSLTAQAKLEEAEQFLREAAAIAEQARLRAAPGPAKASRYRLTVYNELAAVLLARGRQDLAWNQFERGQARELSEALIPTQSPSAFQPFPLERVQRALAPGTAILGWLDVSPGVGEPHSAWGYVIRDHGEVHWVRLAPRGVTLGPAVTSHSPHMMEMISSAASWPLPVMETGEVKREGARLWAERVQPMMPFLDQVDELVVVASPSFHGAVGPMVTERGDWMADRYAISYSPSATLFAWWSEQRVGAGPTPTSTLLIGDPPFSEQQLADMTERSSRSATIVEPALAGPASRTDFNASSVDTLLTGLPRLLGSRWEIDQLRVLFPNATVLEGAKAAEPELYRLARQGRLAQFGTLHVATHVVNRGAWDEWAIVLSQVGPWARPANQARPEVEDLLGHRVPRSARNPADGLLTGPEIRDSLELHCDLVTLSGCLSAGGATGYAAGALGVGNAFLYAGARTILVSMWHADDQAIARFMTRFYENRSGSYSEDRGWGAGVPMRKAVALQEADRWLREWKSPDGRQPYQHPAYWSGLILIGDPG